MPIDTSRFWEQVRLGEDSDLELKEAQFQGQRISAPHRHSRADELAAFANSRGGRFVLGVSDDRQPQSLDPKQLDALVNLVTDICSYSIKPPVEFNIYRVQASTEGGVLLVEILASETVWFREMVGSSCVFDYQCK